VRGNLFWLSAALQPAGAGVSIVENAFPASTSQPCSLAYRCAASNSSNPADRQRFVSRYLLSTRVGTIPQRPRLVSNCSLAFHVALPLLCSTRVHTTDERQPVRNFDNSATFAETLRASEPRHQGVRSRRLANGADDLDARGRSPMCHQRTRPSLGGEAGGRSPGFI
jgi:hypothetical protein